MEKSYFYLENIWKYHNYWYNCWYYSCYFHPATQNLLHKGRWYLNCSSTQVDHIQKYYPNCRGIRDTIRQWMMYKDNLLLIIDRWHHKSNLCYSQIFQIFFISKFQSIKFSTGYFAGIALISFDQIAPIIRAIPITRFCLIYTKSRIMRSRFARPIGKSTRKLTVRAGIAFFCKNNLGITIKVLHF